MISIYLNHVQQKQEGGYMNFKTIRGRIVDFLQFSLAFILFFSRASAQQLPITGDAILNEYVRGNCRVNIVLQKRTSFGGMNATGLSTNRTFSSYTQYQEFVTINGLRLKSFLENGDGDVRFVTSLTSESGEFSVNRNIGPLHGITPDSFRFLPTRPLILAVHSVRSAKYRQSESDEYKTLPVNQMGLVIDSSFATNHGRLRLVLTLETGVVETYTQTGHRIDPPVLTMFRELMYEPWMYYDDYENPDEDPDQFDRSIHHEYIMVQVQATYGADTVVESSADLQTWQQMGVIGWDQYPWLMFEINDSNHPKEPHKFYRVYSY